MNDFLELWKELPSKIEVESPYTGDLINVRLIMCKTDYGNDVFSYEDDVGNCCFIFHVQDDDYIKALNQMKLKLQEEGFM